jgi:hypothetical protein
VSASSRSRARASAPSVNTGSLSPLPARIGVAATGSSRPKIPRSHRSGACRPGPQRAAQCHVFRGCLSPPPWRGRGAPSGGGAAQPEPVSAPRAW